MKQIPCRSVILVDLRAAAVSKPSPEERRPELRSPDEAGRERSNDMYRVIEKRPAGIFQAVPPCEAFRRRKDIAPEIQEPDQSKLDTATQRHKGFPATRMFRWSIGTADIAKQSGQQQPLAD